MAQLLVNVALIECADRAALDEILGAGVDKHVVWRVSDTTVVVDHERLPELLKLLRRQGQTPKITQE